MDLSTFDIAVFRPVVDDQLEDWDPLRQLGCATEVSSIEDPHHRSSQRVPGMETDKTVPRYVRRHHGEWFPLAVR
jgi:hypothetical protein